MTNQKPTPVDVIDNTAPETIRDANMVWAAIKQARGEKPAAEPEPTRTNEQLLAQIDLLKLEVEQRGKREDQS